MSADNGIDIDFVRISTSDNILWKNRKKHDVSVTEICTRENNNQYC